MRACPSEEELQELALEPEESLAPEVRAHLQACPACGTRRDELARQDERLFAELRGVARRAEGPPRIPGYRLEAELSRGGQGVVYRAVQEATSRVVALKLLAAGHGLSARDRRRFEREI